MAQGKRIRPEESVLDATQGVSVNHKRRRLSDTESSQATRYPHLKQVFEYPEVFLNILSFLTATDLAQFERVNRYWKRICTDQWLWKRIYLARYPYPNGRQQRVLTATPSVYGSLDPFSHATSEDSIPTSSGPSSSVGRHSLSSSSEGNLQRPPRHPSPSISQEDDIESQEFSRPRIDWKLLTKIGTNWETGTAAQYSLSPSPSPSPAISRNIDTLRTPTKVSHSSIRDGQPETRHLPPVAPASSRDGRHLLELSPHFIFVAYPNSPLLHVHSSQSDVVENHQDQGKQNPPLALIPPPPGWSSPSRPDHITCIKVDGNDASDTASTSPRRQPVRLVVFYQSGGFVVLSVKSDSIMPTASAGRHARITWTRLVVHAPTDVSRRTKRSAYTRQRADPTVICEFYSPVLVACTERFYISVWRLPDLDADAVTEDGSTARSPMLLQTLHSPVSFHPATLSLKHLPKDVAKVDDEEDEDEPEQTAATDSYRASLAYSVPLYPERWTLAVQDIDITLPVSGDPSATGDVECGECFHVGRSAMAGVKSYRNRWPLLPRSEIVGVKGDRAMIALGDTCCVLAGSDNQIQVYELPRRSSVSDDTHAKRLGHWQLPHTAIVARREIRHVQTLLAHSSAITAIALDQGRCVSAGNDGRILVWQVDRAADVLPAEEGGELEAEAEPVDALGGWVTVRTGLDEKSAGSPGPTWSHVEVRTPRKNDSEEEYSRKRDLGLLPVSPLGRSIASSSATTLHQQFLPVPPVTHPLSLASAAREFLVSPRTGKASAGLADDRAQEEERASRIVEQLAFNEDRIVGLVRSRKGLTGGRAEDARSADSVIKVWTFDV